MQSDNFVHPVIVYVHMWLQAMQSDNFVYTVIVYVHLWLQMCIEQAHSDCIRELVVASYAK